MMRKLLVAPTFILAISNPTEVESERQAVFFATINFSFETNSPSCFFYLYTNYTTVRELQQLINRDIHFALPMH